MQSPSPVLGSRSPKRSLWQAGALIGGRYRLVAPIGAGAMGEVWRADHTSLGTSVAVKLVDTANSEDVGELLGRFQLEARAAAQLRSPHIVQILDHGVDAGVAFMAMELLEGESLEQRIERRGKLTASEAAHVLRELARGLDRAHAAGIVHRDLKPPNVFIARVDSVEVVKVLDFGIAKIVGTPKDAHLQTQAGFVVGTPAYMSPEQVLGKSVDHRSDLWQLAIIAFECILGKRPFDGPTLGQLFMAVCTLPMPVPSAIGPVPPGFDAWFARGADRDPARRFASASEMADALGAVLAPGGVGESAIATLTSMPRTDGAAPGATGHNAAWSAARMEPVRRGPPIALLVGFFLAPFLTIGGGGAWWLLTRHHGVAPVAATAPAAPVPVTTAAPAAPEQAVAAPASATASASTPASATVAPVPPASAPRGPGRTPSGPRQSGPKPPIDLGI